jgi:hypothetical protein
MKTSTTHKGNTMKIELTQEELKDAVRLYVTTELNINLDGKVLTTQFTATRGDAGIVTSLTINKAGAAQAAETAPVEEFRQATINGSMTLSAVAPVVAADTATTAAAVAATEPAAAAAQEDVVTQAQPAEVAEAQVEAVAPAAATAEAKPATTTSLFG